MPPRPATPALYREMTDALGRLLRVPAPPQRIVSLVPSLTELLFELGCGERIVAVSDYCVEPAAEVAGKRRIGGQKDPDLAAIIALAPDLVIANKEENLRRDVERLDEAGIPTFVTDVRTVEAALQLPTTLGVLCGARVEQMERMLLTMTNGVSTARSLAASSPRRPRVAVLVWAEPFIAAGPDTYLSAVLSCLGADNVAAELSSDRRYPKLSGAELLALHPERLLLPSEPYPFSESHRVALQSELGIPCHLIDGPVACWYGPRTARIPELLPALRS